MGYDPEERKQRIQEEARKAVEELSRFVNVLGEDKERADAFVEYVRREHRTLQQGMMKLVVAMLEGWDKALDDHDYDLHNEATCRLAKKLLSATGDKYDRFLPCI